MTRRRLLVLATYPKTAAATRYRALAFFHALAERGIDADFHPFMDDAFMRDLYTPGARAQKAANVARFALRRLALLVRARRYDAVFVQREAALIGPALFESALVKGLRLPLIFDFDDAIWLQHTAGSKHPLAAKLLKAPSKTNDLLAMATETIAGTNYLASYASRFTGSVTVIPTVVSRDLFTPLAGRLEGRFAGDDGVPTIGWIGTHSTATHLDMVVPALNRLAREGLRFRVRLVGASRTLPLDGVDVESVPWRAETEVADFQRIDIGIAPVVDDDWSRGKCGFKQVQYMAVGAPMVSSAVGGVAEVIDDGVTALIARSNDEWCTHLRTLLSDRDVRARLSQNGRRSVEQRLSTEVQAQAFTDVVERAMSVT